MALVLEDGSAPDGANSYATETMLGDYADARGITLATGDAEAALIRATAAIDIRYRGQFSGTKTNGRDQALQWPRSGAVDAEGLAIASDEIPQEVIDATCEASIRELTEAGSMLPDLDRGNNIKRLKAGSVEIEYGSNASSVTTFQLIDGIMASLLGSAPSPYAASAVRG